MNRIVMRSTLVVGALCLAACATTQSRMHRALDPSMERALSTEGYLATVAGISQYPERLTRGDGYVYLSDLAPQMRYLATVGDTARFRALRSFVYQKMMRRDAAGMAPILAYREGAASRPATPYGVRFLREALRGGWRLMGDTLSATMLAQMQAVDAPLAGNSTRIYQLTMDCNNAEEAVGTDPAPARAVVARAKAVVGNLAAAAEQAASGSTEIDGETDLLSCLTRVGLALQDPDVTVRYLDRLLDQLNPLLSHSGRPSLGTSADVLFTLYRVRRAGPAYYDPGSYLRPVAHGR